MNQNMGKLMQQAQEMQEKMKEVQKAQKNLEVEGQSGAGLVKVVMTGKHDLKSVKLDPSLLSEDKEMLEDLVAAAVNDANRRVEEKSQSYFSGLSQGFDLPQGFKLPF